MTQLDIAIEPADQRRAAQLGEAFVESNEAKVGDLLAELVDAGLERTIAVAAVLARNLSITLVELVGAEVALAQLERTKLDAMVAE